MNTQSKKLAERIRYFGGAPQFDMEQELEAYRKAVLQEAADALKPWVHDGPHNAILRLIEKS